MIITIITSDLMFFTIYLPKIKKANLRQALFKNIVPLRLALFREFRPEQAQEETKYLYQTFLISAKWFLKSETGRILGISPPPYLAKLYA